MNKKKVDIKLKSFIENHIPFYDLKKAGLWPKGTRVTDYEAQAAIICNWFSLNNIYEYAEIGKGMRVHLSLAYHNHEFNCPICTCKQTIAISVNLSAFDGAIIKCDGCKRPLNIKIKDKQVQAIATDDENDVSDVVNLEKFVYEL